MAEMTFEQKQALDIIKAQFEMHNNTLVETERKMRDMLKEDGSKMYSDEQIENRLNQIRSVIRDTVDQYVQTGGDPMDLEVKKPKKQATRTQSGKKITTTQVKKEIKKEENKTEVKKKTTMSYIPKKREYGNSVPFDVIPLPSKGEPYKDKFDRVQVSYLTANDENMFVSPNLYRDGLLIEFLLNEKIMDENVVASELLDGDRDAIILWLRATGYGNDFPITAKDNVTGTEFDSVVDLSKIKFKEFDLKADENGYFPFILPMTKDEIKFKFLNHREVEEIKKEDILESPSAVKSRLEIISNDLRKFLDNDESMNKHEKERLYDACRNIEDWSEGIEDDGQHYSNTITNRLEAQIMSINGNTNRGFISEYIKNMPVRDSLALRKYMADNEPGLDFNIEVAKPKSLGGGSQSVFLQVDQFVFLNVS